jgi:hypothetical protein
MARLDTLTPAGMDVWYALAIGRPVVIIEAFPAGLGGGPALRVEAGDSEAHPASVSDPASSLDPPTGVR